MPKKPTTTTGTAQMIKFRSPSEICSHQQSAAETLVGDNHIVRGDAMVIGGEPGAGKSTLALDLAFSGATGAPSVDSATSPLLPAPRETMLLDLAKLESVKERGRKTIPRCSACAEEGGDDKGEEPRHAAGRTPWLRRSPRPLGRDWPRFSCGKRKFRHPATLIT
jgi:hypothetical protein